MSTANNTQSSHVARVKLLAHKLADTVLNTTHDTLHAYVPELIAPTEATTLASMLFLVATSVYFAAWLSLGWAWLILLFGLLSSVFEKQLSRLRTRIRADERRSLANETFLDESVEWLNALLLRFWLRFEPGLSVTIQQIADLSLASFKPVFLSDLRLSKFSLGSANPVITTIRTHARSNESLTLDLDLQFVPHEHAASNSEQRNLVVQLLARVGLGPASVPLTVVLTDVALHGTMRVELDFSAAFPHIQTVKLAFVEAPLLDYQLKPLGTGDINSIAAIASFLSSTVSSALSSFIVHPNYLTLDIAALMGVGDHDLPVGILRIRLHEAAGLRNVDIASLSDPYAIVTIGDQEIARTRTLFDDLSPKWAQTFDVVVTRAMLASPLDLLQIKVIHAGKLGPVSLGATESLSLVRWVQLLDTASTSPTTSESDPQVPNMSEKAEKAEPEKNDAEFPSGEVNAPRALDDKEAVQIVRQWGSPLYERSDRWLSLYDYSLQPTKGAVHADMAYFPIDPAVKILSNAGLVTLTIHQAKDLPSRRQGHPFVLVNFRGDVIGKTSVKKRTSSPVWAHTIRFFCEDITDAFVRLAVHDDQKFSISDLASPVYGECLLPITEALNEHGEWYPLKNPSSPGKLKIDLQFTPVDLAQSDVDRTLIPRFAPVGVVRLHIIEAKELTNVELLRKSDPYVKVKVGRTRVGVTQAIENTLDPEWRETFYGIAYSAETLLSLELYDFNEIQKDKWLGKVAIPLDMLVKGSLQPCRSEQDQRDMDNLRNAYNVDGLKVSAKQGSTDSLDVWAPVYISKHSAADPKTAAHAASKDSLHPSDADHIGIAGVGAAVGAVGAGAHSLVRSATSFAKDLTKGKDSKMKAKGRIHFELDFFPVHEPIVRTTYPSPRVLEDGTLDCIHATPIDQNAREIVSTQIESALIHRKCRAYLEISQDTEQFFSTRTSPLSTHPEWHEQLDRFLPEFQTTVFSIVCKEQRGNERAGSDTVLGSWTGDVVDFMGISSYKLGLRQYAASQSVVQEALPITCHAILSFAYSPVKANPALLVTNEATDIMAADSGGTSDPYVVARLNGVQFFKTKTIKKTLIPVFEETTQTQIFEKANSVLQFELFDFNVLSKNKSLGCVLIPLKDLGDSEMVIKKLPISSAPGHSKGFLSVRLFFDSRAATKKGIDMEQRAESTQGAMSKMTRGLTYSITQQIHFPKGKKTVAPRVVVGPTGTSTMQVPEIQVSADTPERDLNKRRPLAGSGGTLEALNQAQNIVDEAGPKLQEATGGEVPASELLAEAGAMTEGVDAALANIESDMVQPEVSGAASMRSVNSTHSISGHEGALATIHILGASALRAADATGLSDPYIKVQLIREGKAPKTLLKTAVCKKTLNPSWIDEKITVPLGSTLAFLILDHNNIMSSVKLGHVDVETSALFEKSDHFESAFNIENGNGTLQLTGDLAHPARASSNNSSPSSGDRLQRSGSTASMRKTAKDMFKKIAPFSKH